MQRNFGAVIVNNDQIISTGYTGAPRKRKNCIDIGRCIRKEHKIPRGRNYEFCRSVHAEMNAIIHATRSNMIDSTLYLYGIEVETNKVVKNAQPCIMCKKLIINAGIKKVIVQINSQEYKEYDVKNDWVEKDDTLDMKPQDFGY